MAVAVFGDTAGLGSIALGDFAREEVAVQKCVDREGSILGARNRRNAADGVEEGAKYPQGKTAVGDKVVEGEAGELVLADRRDLDLGVGEIKHPAIGATDGEKVWGWGLERLCKAREPQIRISH